MESVILLNELLLTINGTENLAPSFHGVLFKGSACPKLTQYPGLLKFLLEPLQSLVNGLVFFDIDNQHAFLSVRAANISHHAIVCKITSKLEVTQSLI